MKFGISVSREYEALLSDYDVLITPTVPSTAPKLVPREAGLLEQWKADQAIALNTAQFNLTGNPAMALPIGFLPDLSGADENVKLPVSMQIVGPLHGEDKVLKVGYAYEKMFDCRKE
jgi:amidase